LAEVIKIKERYKFCLSNDKSIHVMRKSIILVTSFELMHALIIATFMLRIS